MSVDLSVDLAICLSVCLSVDLYIYVSVCLSVSISVYLSVCIYVYLSICLSVCLSVRLSVYLSIYLSIWSIYLSMIIIECQCFSVSTTECAPLRMFVWIGSELWHHLQAVVSKSKTHVRSTPFGVSNSTSTSYRKESNTERELDRLCGECLLP